MTQHYMSNIEHMIGYRNKRSQREPVTYPENTPEQRKEKYYRRERKMMTALGQKKGSEMANPIFKIFILQL